MSIPIHAPLRAAGALAALAGVALLAATPAHATGATSAVCVTQFIGTISPGLGFTPSSGTETTHGETGSITCVGTLAGARITGPGTAGFDLTYTASTCAAQSSAGTVRVTIPTTAGNRHVVAALTVRSTALALRVEARSEDHHYSGVGVVIPLQGNCFFTPMRKASIVLTGSINDA